jgi:hypothetical protein
VDDELLIARLHGFGYGLDVADIDFALHVGLFDVVQTLVGQQESSLLFHAPLVEFNDKTGVDDAFALVDEELVEDLLVLGAPHVVDELGLVVHNLTQC